MNADNGMLGQVGGTRVERYTHRTVAFYGLHVTGSTLRVEQRLTSGNLLGDAGEEAC